MIQDDIFVNQSRLSLSSVAELPGFIEKVTGCKSSSKEDVILILCAFAVYLSYEELYLLYPAHTSSMYSAIATLKKKGYITTQTNSKEGLVDTFFTLTSAGYKEANVLCEGQLSKAYKKRTVEAISHTYNAGYNFFQLLLLGQPLQWEREVVYTDLYKRRYRKGTLQIDGIGHLYRGTKEHLRIYIEQDMGFEPPETLVAKIDSYNKFGLMDDDASLVFSFKNARAKLEDNPLSRAYNGPYSEKRCAYLLKKMKETGIYDAYMLMEAGVVDREFMEKLLILIGAAVRNESGYLSRGSTFANKKVIEDFRNGLVTMTNPYEMKEFNEIHHHLAMNRFFAVAKKLVVMLPAMQPYTRRMLEGKPVLFVPTTLLADRMKWLLIDKYPHLIEKLKDSLLFYYKNVKYEGKFEVRLPNGQWVDYRNTFSYQFDNDVHGRICVEYPFMDLGAYIRGKFLVGAKTTETIHHLMIFETREQFESFFRLVQYHFEDLWLVPNKSSTVCIYLDDIGKEKKIFAPIINGDMVDAFGLRTSAVKEET